MSGQPQSPSRLSERRRRWNEQSYHALAFQLKRLAPTQPPVSDEEAAQTAKEHEHAATKIQAIRRGKDARTFVANALKGAFSFSNWSATPPAGAPPALAPPALEVVAQAALPRSCSSTRATAVGVELLQDADLRI